MAKKKRKIKTSDEIVPAIDPQPDVITPATGSPLWRHDGPWALLLLFFVIAAYLPVWHAGFMWDDGMFVAQNSCIVGPFGLKEIWTTSAARFYPFVLSTFWLEHAFWGIRPLPYHLVNILLHAGCAVVLWRALKALQVPGAWMGAAIWALHPVQVETAAWISEMKNTESCLFYLLTILFFVKGLKPSATGQGSGFNRNYVLTLLFALLAMLSKSSTLMLIAVLALCAWWVRGRWQWRDMTRIVPILLMALVIGLIEMQTVKQNGTDELQWAESWQQRMAIGGEVFWYYLGKLIWPHPLVTCYPRWTVDAAQWTSYVPLISIVLVLGILWWKRQSWSRPYFFAFAYYLMNLLPVMGLFSMTGFRYSLVEDHLQYLASMGPLALFGAGLARISHFELPRKLWLQPAFSAGLLLVLGILTWQQSRLYKDEHTLWTYNLTVNPESWLAYDGLGVEYTSKGQIDKAIEFYQKSLAINPNYAVTHNNLGTAYTKKGQMDDAMDEYQKALDINPNSAQTHLELGQIFSQKDRMDEAIFQFQKALDLDPRYISAYNALGLALAQKGKVAEAIEQYQKALVADPNFAMAHHNLGAVLFQNGQMTEAIAEYQKALAIDPTLTATRSNLALAQTQKGVLFLQQQQLDEAIAQFQEAIKNDPSIAQAHSDLGIALAQKGQLTEALIQFQEALHLKPDDSAAQVNLAKIKAMIDQKTASP